MLLGDGGTGGGRWVSLLGLDHMAESLLGSRNLKSYVSAELTAAVLCCETTSHNPLNSEYMSHTILCSMLMYSVVHYPDLPVSSTSDSFSSPCIGKNIHIVGTQQLL